MKLRRLFAILFLFFSASLFANPFAGQPGIVIIDAGHGGKDSGAQGFGTNEKDVTLRVAELLSEELDRRGVATVLTRESDVYLSLEDRASFSRSQSAPAGTYPIFISIHCNSSTGESASGFEVYVKENQSVPLMYYRDMASSTLLAYSSYSKSQLNRYLNIRSRAAAENIISAFSVAFPSMKNRGVKETDFYVLINTPMPAVLVELGFLSNPEENKIITSATFQAKAAEAIADAILR
jgi:N-acetylmuramoyl-L-alanine amidase